MIPTLRRISSILPLARRLADTSSVILIVLSLAIMFAAVVDDAVHGLVTATVGQFVGIKTETGPASRTATLALVVPSQRVATRKPAAALGTGMWALTSVEFRVSFQVMETSKSSLARGTLVWLLLAVCQEMALEIVVSRKIGRAVWALVSLRRRRLGAVLRIAWQTHLARGCTWIMLGRHWAREGECAIARAFPWVRRYGLVVRLGWMWRWLLLLLLWWWWLLLLGRGF
jgi:hypothetical protein